MKILSIDPGTEQSGFVIYEPETMTLYDKGILSNEDMRLKIKDSHFDVAAVEMIASYGMAVGKTTFETCVWIGQFKELIQAKGIEYYPIYRGEVKDYLCHSRRAKDSNIRQAILDHFPRTGGGSTPEVGTKKEQGKLYGIKSHIWSALAVAITYEMKYLKKAAWDKNPISRSKTVLSEIMNKSVSELGIDCKTEGLSVKEALKEELKELNNNQ